MSKPPKSPAKATADKVPSDEGLSQDDVAVLVPCSQATVSRYDRRGWLTRTANGRLAETAIEEVRARIADHETDDGADPDTKRRLDVATMRLREAQAQIREHELEVESGKFADLAEVQRDAADTRERILGVLRAIPQRTAMALECPCARAAVVESKIREEVERAIAELAQAKFGGTP